MSRAVEQDRSSGEREQRDEANGDQASKSEHLELISNWNWYAFFYQTRICSSVQPFILLILLQCADLTHFQCLEVTGFVKTPKLRINCQHSFALRQQTCECFVYQPLILKTCGFNKDLDELKKYVNLIGI